MKIGLCLDGQGAAYVRVSTDEQDTERQYEAIKKFLSENDASIEPKWWFEDKAFRDNEDRPDFRHLLSLADKEKIQWIVVDSTERFAMKSTKRFIGLLGDLEEWGCKLYTVDGKEWTEGEIATEVQALIKGHESYQEGVSRSYRVLGKLAIMAKEGLYLGGFPPFGFDVATFPNKSEFEEIWRVIWQPEQGRHKRIKVWPDGTEERWDGKGNMPPIGKDEIRRLVPSKDQEKLNAVREVFERYAQQKLSFNAIAGYLNGLGYRAGGSSIFSATHIPDMLSQPAYISMPGWNRRHVGKFHRWANGKQTRMGKPTTKSGKGMYEKNAGDDWIISKDQWYEPFVDREVWDAVQEKLQARTKKRRTSRSPNFILSGLLVCGHCGQRMSGGNRKMRDGRREPEYYCSTYHRWVSGGRKDECDCQRHTMKQSEVVGLLGEYLEDVSEQLDALEESQRTGNLKLLEPYQKNLVNCVKNESDVLRRMFEFCFSSETNCQDVEEMEFQVGLLRLWLDTYRRDPLGFEELLIDYYNGIFDSRYRDNENIKNGLESRLDELIANHKELPKEAHRARQRVHEEILEVELQLDELEMVMEKLSDHLYRIDDELIATRHNLVQAREALDKDLTEDVLREQAEAISRLISSVTCNFSQVNETTPRKTGQTRRMATVWDKIVVVPKGGESVTIERGCEDTTDSHARSPDRDSH